MSASHVKHAAAPLMAMIEYGIVMLMVSGSVFIILHDRKRAPEVLRLSGAQILSLHYYYSNESQTMTLVLCQYSV